LIQAPDSNPGGLFVSGFLYDRAKHGGSRKQEQRRADEYRHIRDRLGNPPSKTAARSGKTSICVWPLQYPDTSYAYYCREYNFDPSED